MISFHMGVPAERIAEAHDAGSRWMQQVGDRRTAELALEAGTDVLVAQGWEAGGNAGWVGTMALVPDVVDSAGAVPVLAGGGIADGRGVAAALALGAQGVVLGTRFLASVEMPIDASWKSRIVAAEATDAVKVPNSERVMPPFTLELPPGPRPAPRTLRTSLTEQLETDPDAVDAATVAPTLIGELRANRGHQLLPFTGQSAALVREVLPAAEIVSRLVAEARAALDNAASAANA